METADSYGRGYPEILPGITFEGIITASAVTTESGQLPIYLEANTDNYIIH